MRLGNTSLFLVTVLIWGTTWFVILGQLGTVHPVVSVGWRFLAAGLILLVMCWFWRIPLVLPRAVHGLCLLQGLTLFGINYCLFYTASVSVTTGLISVVFSTMVFWNALGAHWVLGRVLDLRALLGGIIGLTGLGVLFIDELRSVAWSKQDLIPLGLCVLATLCASTGNLVSSVTQGRGYSVWSTTAFGMLYGAFAVLIGAISFGIPLKFEWTAVYVGSFLYLVIAGSVIAFGAYLTLLGRIGPGRVAYTTVAFPVVALAMSALFESIVITPWSGLAIVSVLVGNWIALSGAKKSTCAVELA